MSKSTLSLGLVALFLLGACGGHKEERPQIFFGECHLKVEASPKHAEILVDGVLAGHGQVDVAIPCGEKQVRVREEGYLPYEAYFPLTADQAQKVTVKLETFKPSREFALSSEIVDQVRAGRRPRDTAVLGPYTDPAPVLAAPKAEGTEAAAAGGGGSVAPGAFSTNVEDWR